MLKSLVCTVVESQLVGAIDKGLISLLVLQALNVPNIKTIFGGERECFVTLGYQATKTKVKKTKKTNSIQIERQTAVWNQTLNPLYAFLIFNPFFQLKFPSVPYCRLHDLYCVFMQSV